MTRYSEGGSYSLFFVVWKNATQRESCPLEHETDEFSLVLGLAQSFFFLLILFTPEAVSDVSSTEGGVNWSPYNVRKAYRRGETRGAGCDDTAWLSRKRNSWEIITRTSCEGSFLGLLWGSLPNYRPACFRWAGKQQRQVEGCLLYGAAMSLVLCCPVHRGVLLERTLPAAHRCCDSFFVTCNSSSLCDLMPGCSHAGDRNLRGVHLGMLCMLLPIICCQLWLHLFIVCQLRKVRFQKQKTTRE